MIKRLSIAGWLASASVLALAPSGLSLAADVAAESQQLSEINAELRSLNAKAGRLAEIQASIQQLERRLNRLLDSGWEYRFLARNRFSDLVQQTNHLGAEGWELVAVTQDEGFIFKRRLPAVR
jgi:hypothetical protein